MPASDPNGRFITYLGTQLFGLLGISVCSDFLGFSSVRTSWVFCRLGLLGLLSVRISWAVLLSGLLGCSSVRSSLIALLEFFVC